MPLVENELLNDLNSGRCLQGGFFPLMAYLTRRTYFLEVCGKVGENPGCLVTFVLALMYGNTRSYISAAVFLVQMIYWLKYRAGV